MQLRPYQAEAVEFLRSNGGGLLALPPGAGKTAIVADYTMNLAPDARILVVCPNGPVMQHWRAEMLQWAGRPAGIGTGTPGLRKLARVAVEKGGTLILNYECFRRDIGELLERSWDLVVFDESHRLKNRQSQTFKAARLLKPDRMILVSGTPVMNRANELWTSLHLLKPQDYRSYWRWAESFFQINYPRYGRRIVREVAGIRSPEHLALLRKQVHEVMYYRPLKEILPDLPDVVETYYEIPLTTEEYAAQAEMEQNFWMEVGEELVQAPNKVAQMTRLQQLCSDWSVFGEAPGSKCQFAVDLLEDLDQPTVVFVKFRNTADALVSILPPSSAAAYHGGLAAKDREHLLAKFKAGRIKTLVCTIKTMGEAVDGLQHLAHTAVFLDRDWTPARNDQAIGRLHRLGQKDNVNVIHVVADESIDNDVATALAEKRDVISAVMDRRKHAVHP